MKSPGQVLRSSKTRYEETPDELDYGEMETRRVHPVTGTISYGEAYYRISIVFGGWNVGLSPRKDVLIEVWFVN